MWQMYVLSDTVFLLNQMLFSSLHFHFANAGFSKSENAFCPAIEAQRLEWQTWWLSFPLSFSFPSGSFALFGPTGPHASPPMFYGDPWQRPELRWRCHRRPAARSTESWPRGRRSSPWRLFACIMASGQSSETVRRGWDEREENRTMFTWGYSVGTLLISTEDLL